MKRRDFLAHSTAFATVSAALMVLTGVNGGALAAQFARPRLVEAPLAWIGERFRLASGQVIELVAVEPAGYGGPCVQSTLRFRVVSGQAPVDGIHELLSGGSVEPLFLQPGKTGPIACLNRMV